MEKFIKPTKEYLQMKFNEFNELYFDEILPPCKMSLHKAKGYFGSYNILSGNKPKISIAEYVYWTEEELRLTLIHEMVHHYVCFIDKPKHFVLPHGYLFRRECRKLKKKHGLKIRILSIPDVYFYKEKVPTTYIGKLWRRYFSIKFE